MLIRHDITRQAEATILASLALAAQKYADPTPCYQAIRELRPEVDWTPWIDEAERDRAEREISVSVIHADHCQIHQCQPPWACTCVIESATKREP